MSGSRDAWPTRLVVISGSLLVAVLIEAVASVVAALAVPAGSWMSFSAIISPVPGSTPSSTITSPETTTQLAGRTSTLHDQLAVASQWAAPIQGMLILAAVVLVAHIVGTTDAADERRLNRQMSWLCRSAAFLAVLMFVAGVIGIVTDIWGMTGQGAQLHAPVLATHVIGTVFAAVATWLAIGTVAELKRHAGSIRPASGPSEA
jgi:hypothetical protein